MPNRRTLLKGTASALLAAAVLPAAAFARAPFAATIAPAFHRLTLGALEITAISDGAIKIPLASLYTNTTDEHAEAALAAAFQGPASETSVNAFLVNTGERLVLIDAGTGAYLGPALGKLIANIEASGYTAAQIDDVILTHVHTDHSGGLVKDGKRVFENATLHVNARDVDYWLDQAEQDRAPQAQKAMFAQARECLTPYLDAGTLKSFADNAEILPGFASILRAGHTPGHSSIVVESQGQTMVFWGDITHGDVLQFDEPGVAIEFDVDQVAAVAARTLAFAAAADGAYLVAGAHIGFPGIGHLRRDDSNYGWVPLNYDTAL